MFLHIDIDCFFASAERTVNPSLNDIPIAVGGRSNLEIFNQKRTRIRLMNNNSGAFVAPVFYSERKKTFESCFVEEHEGRKKIRGIITTASYEARKYGVKTAMPIAQALQLCPHLVVVPSNYRLYHQLSHRMHLFIQKQIPSVEQYSIDEFFGDVHGWVKDAEIYHFAIELQNKIKTHFNLPVSIGISKAKWIAKLATESAKPNGVYLVEDIDYYIEHIPIEKFPGIGRGFQSRLKSYHISTLGDVKRNQTLLYRWKKPGIQLYRRVTGTDNEGICSKSPRKSIGISRTFDPVYNVDEVKRRIMIMARHIIYMVMAAEENPTTYYLKIRYEYNIKVKKRVTVERLFSETLFKKTLVMMYEEIFLPQRGAVKLTVNVSNFSVLHKKTLSLIDLPEDMQHNHLSRKIQILRETFGLDIVKTANEL